MNKILFLAFLTLASTSSLAMEVFDGSNCPDGYELLSIAKKLKNNKDFTNTCEKLIDKGYRYDNVNVRENVVLEVATCDLHNPNEAFAFKSLCSKKDSGEASYKTIPFDGYCPTKTKPVNRTQAIKSLVTIMSQITDKNMVIGFENEDGVIYQNNKDIGSEWFAFSVSTHHKANVKLCKVNK